MQGQPTAALDHAQQALKLHRLGGHKAGVATALNAVGWAYALVGEYEQAVVHCEQALTLLAKHGAFSVQASTWDSLGYAHHLGCHEQAIDCYQPAIALQRKLGDRYHVAGALAGLGDAHLAAGDPQAARRAWQEAQHMFHHLDHPDLDRVRDKLRDLDHR